MPVNDKQPNYKNIQMVGDYSKLMPYFLSYFNTEKDKYKQDKKIEMDQFLKVLIASLLKIIQQPENFNFLSYLVLHEDEQFLIEALQTNDIQYLRDALGHTPLDYAIEKYDHKKTNILIDFLSKHKEMMALTTQK